VFVRYTLLSCCALFVRWTLRSAIGLLMCDFAWYSLQAYNITNDEPIYFWTFLTQLIVGLGYAAPKYHLPYWLIYVIAVMLSWFVALLRPVVTLRPTFTPMTVALAGTHHYYSCQHAKDDMQYQPKVPLEKAVAETIESFDHLRNKSE